MTPFHYVAVAIALILASLGFYLNDDGKVTKVPPNTTLQEVAENTDQTSETTELPYIVDESDYVAAETLVTGLVQGDLSTEEMNDLLFMREEEKLARDVYLALGETWGMKIFSNIAVSEETHTEAIRTLLERYDLEDPAQASRGEFTNPDLQALYNALITEGKTSLAAALTVGARIEDLDIRDLDATLARTNNLDITTVYENLQRGSRNHLRAFNRQLVATTGVAYVPEYISEADFNAIIGSETERGNAAQGANRSGNGGQGNGRGSGGGQ